MCAKCDEIDEKIAKYRSFLHAGLDPLTTERIEKLTANLEQQKIDIHEA